MKKICYLIVMYCFLLCISVCMAETDAADDATAQKMAEFDKIVAEIKGYPEAIDADICGKDWASYRTHMTELAQKIIDANTLIKDVALYYPIDLWIVYNTISADPSCGIGIKAKNVFNVADVSRYSNEERMGVRYNEDLCYCWNIITGREELTGYYKDGACRCIYGTKNLNPDIGINETP